MPGNTCLDLFHGDGEIRAVYVHFGVTVLWPTTGHYVGIASHPFGTAPVYDPLRVAVPTQPCSE